MKQAARACRLTPTARQEHLLGHALAVFAHQGVGDARPTDLAVAAGVSVPTVFHYFPTRESLQEAMLAEVSRLLLDGILAGESKATRPATEAVEEVLRAFCGALATHPHHVRIWLKWSDPYAAAGGRPTWRFIAARSLA